MLNMAHAKSNPVTRYMHAILSKPDAAHNNQDFTAHRLAFISPIQMAYIAQHRQRIVPVLVNITTACAAMGVSASRIVERMHSVVQARVALLLSVAFLNQFVM